MALPVNRSLFLPKLLQASKTSISHSLILSATSPLIIPDNFTRLKKQRKLLSHPLLRTSCAHGHRQMQLTISETFLRLKKQRKIAFILYITAGDPDLLTTEKALRLLSSSGADLIELGLPYSDPILDGPVIQASAVRASSNGINFQAVISMLAKVLLATPTTPRHQMKAIVDATDGFLYLVTTNGITGIRSNLNPQVKFRLDELKKETSKPIAVGFGISKPEHLKQLSKWGANGVIVGSTIVKLLGESKSSEEGLRHLETFTKQLTSTLSIGL